MMSFENALEHMLEFEGGYVNDPDDSGGETFRGISRRNWPAWAGWDLIDNVKARGARTARLIDAALAQDAEMESLVAEFYRREFWRPWERHGLPERLTAKLFDTAVNMGAGRAAKLLQTAVNALGPVVRLVVDGAIGPRTLDALGLILDTPAGEGRVLAAYAEAQADHYRAIVRGKPSQEKYLKGWLRRAAWLP